MNFNYQALSRSDMKQILGGNLTPAMCPICKEDPYWVSYPNKQYCVAWDCPIIVPPLQPCPINDPNC